MRSMMQISSVRAMIKQAIYRSFDAHTRIDSSYPFIHRPKNSFAGLFIPKYFFLWLEIPNKVENPFGMHIVYPDRNS